MKKLITYLLTGAMMMPPSFSNLEASLSNSESSSIETYNKKPEKIADTVIFKKYVQNLNAPKYKLAPENCARYLTKSAKKLFGKKYTLANAWNMRYHNKVVSEITDTSEIRDLIREEKLTPGMAVGFYNSKSRYKNKKDEMGKKRTYTHVALYIGLNEKFEPEFVHQDGRKIKTSTMVQMSKSGYKPRIILDENENLTKAD